MTASGCSSLSMSRQRPCASSHGPITSAGSTKPIKPLASTASAHSTQPSSSQRSDKGAPAGSSSARASASTAALMSPPTSMSWFAYCAPMKKKGQVASTPSVMLAARGPCQRRSAKNSAAPISHAPSIEAMRPANGVGPKSCIAAMSSQYISGGLWKNGRPFSVGTRPSPLPPTPSSISRATLA